MYCWPTSLRCVAPHYGLTRLRLDGPLALRGTRRLPPVGRRSSRSLLVKPRETRDRNRTLRVVVSDTERERISAGAKAAGLSVSAFLRNLGLGHTIHSAYDQEAVIALLRATGDQGRLGGLLKLWLTERPGEGAAVEDVRALLDQVEAATHEVRLKAYKI